MTGNPPLATPLSGAGVGHGREQHQARQRDRQAGRRRSHPTFTDPNFMPARMQTWNVNVEREIGAMGLMVGYFGSHGDRLRIPINLNQFMPGGPCGRTRRVSADEPDRAGRDARQHHRAVSTGWSDYKALWVTVNRRLSKGLQLSGSYTLSKSTDTNSDDGTTVRAGQLEPRRQLRARRTSTSVIASRSTRRTICRSRATASRTDGRSSSSSKRRPAIRSTS